MQKNCSYCGTRLGNGYLFCSHCGTPLSGTSSAKPVNTLLDDNHKALLSLFLKPRSLDIDTWQDIWSGTFRKPYMWAIREFIDKNLLTRPTVEESLIGGLRIADIKPILREHGLKLSGRKAELVKRLVEQLPNEAKELASKLKDIYVCTETGSSIAQQWKDDANKRRTETEEKMGVKIAEGNFRQAFRLRERLRKTIPEPMQASYGGGSVGGESSWDDQDELSMRAIYQIDPKSIPSMTPEEVKKAKFNMIMSLMCPWGRTRYKVSKEFDKIARTRNYTAYGHQRLKKWRKSGVVVQVEILGENDACLSCKNLQSYRYDITDVPIIPNPNCTDDYGCRCCYVPITRTMVQRG
ncbi:MAG: SAP domain-containing protein [Candidatus Hodarchaeales archaeon]|jgi:hypothetical protein